MLNDFTPSKKRGYQCHFYEYDNITPIKFWVLMVLLLNIMNRKLGMGWYLYFFKKNDR